MNEYGPKINEAKKAGYSDDEIVSFLSEKDSKFSEKYKMAKEEGYSSSDILQHLSPPKREKSYPERSAIEAITHGPTEYATRLLGAYGDILDLAHLQQKEQLLPGQKARLQAEQQLPEQYLPYLGGDDLAPEYARLPSSSESRQFLQKLGAPEGEPTTLLGRISTALSGAAGGAHALGAGGALPQILRGAAVGQGAREVGAPNWLASVLDVGATLANPVSITKEALKYTSGLPKRLAGRVKKPTAVSPGQATKIAENLEGDFRKISEELLAKNQTYKSMKDLPEFEENLSKGFEKVETLAKDIKGKVEAEDLKKSLLSKFKKTANLGSESEESILRQLEETPGKKSKKIVLAPAKGITASDYEKAYSKEIRSLLKEIPNVDASAEALVDQYRKNNKALTQYFESGSSIAKNNAKRDALLDYNQAIAESFEKNFKDSEFSKLFKETNKIFSEKRSIEDLETWVDSIFTHGPKKAEKIFSNEKLQRSAEKILGKDGVQQVKQLTKDLLTEEQARKLIKASEKAGFSLNGKDALKYLVFPKWATVPPKAKSLAQAAYNQRLLKPQTRLLWGNYLNEMKTGKYEKAAHTLEELARSEEEI